MLLVLALALQPASQPPLLSPYELRSNPGLYEDMTVRTCGLLDYEGQENYYHLYGMFPVGANISIRAGVALRERPGRTGIGKRTCVKGKIVFNESREERARKGYSTMPHAAVDYHFVWSTISGVRGRLSSTIPCRRAVRRLGQPPIHAAP